MEKLDIDPILRDPDGPDGAFDNGWYEARQKRAHDPVAHRVRSIKVSICHEHIYISSEVSDAFHAALHTIGQLCGNDLEKCFELISALLTEMGCTVTKHECEIDPFHNNKRIFNPRLP